MARGWQSKSVEEQIEAAEVLRAQPAAPAANPGIQERLRRRESLQLTRTRVLRELENSQNPRYQEMQRKALAELDAQIAALGS